MLKKYLHIIPILLLLPFFIYIVYMNIIVASKQVVTNNHLYNISAEVSPEIKAIAQVLKSKSLHKNYDDYIIQSLLDYVTNIPYKENTSKARKPIETINRNYGDCDDKSNLMSSLLTSLGYENYIVLVPNHAFVIVYIKKKSTNLKKKKSLIFNQKEFYILETTSKNSKIGFEIEYELQDIEALVDPVNKLILHIDHIDYK